MNASQPLEARLQALLQERQRRVKEKVRLARKDPSEPNVHDLRVACRRLDAGLKLLQELAPELPRLAGLRKKVRKVRGLAGELRDLQVLADWLEPQRERWPELESVLRRVPRLIRREQRGLQRRLARCRLKKLKKPLSAPPRVHPDALRALCEAREQAFQRRLAERSDWHEARLALKSYRYLAEMLDDLGLARPDLEALRTWQDRLGKLQDLEVQAERLERFGLRKLSAFLEYWRDERRRLVEEL